MNKQFVIVTDSNSDLPIEYRKAEDISHINLSFTLEGVTHKPDDGTLTEKEFYDIMRKGSMPITAQINIEDAKQALEPFLKEGKDVLHIAFSSGLSGSYNSVRVAAEELHELYPERKLIVIDSLCASLGQGMLVYKAVELRKQGKTMEEIAAWCEENKLRVCHYFTVDDLFHLQRGGRVSKTAAIVGSMLGIKPLLHIDNEGKLIPLSKIRGRKPSLTALVDSMEKLIIPEENDVIMISHGDCEEDAKHVAELIHSRFGMKNIVINYVGPTIGAHSGPGTVALFFMGKNR